MKLVIGHLYPDLLNLYGDRGNIACMKKRLEWRGIEGEVREYHLDSWIPFSELDIVLLGGGSDREQRIVCRRLRQVRDEFHSYVEDGGTVLAVCGGYQLLGEYYDTGEDKIEGLSIADLYTERGEGRLISNIVIENSRYSHPVAGFENHAGRTYVGEHTPFGRVLYGNGNNGKDGKEGILYKNVTGTYLHGPLLPKNPSVADDLLAGALDRRYGAKLPEGTEDTLELLANAYIVERFLPGYQRGENR